MNSLLLALTVSAATLVAGLGQTPVVSFNGSTDDDFQIAGGAVSAGQILVSENDYWGVIRAAGDLAVDFGRVTGTNYTLSTDSRLGGTRGDGNSSTSAAQYWYNPVNNKNNTYYTTTAPESFTGPLYSPADPSSVVIIAGTIGNSTLIDALVTSGALDTSQITGKWESFTTQLIANPAAGVSRALVIAGSDPRGTIYGLYDVSEQIGVSPWYFWADTPPRQHTSIFVPADLAKTQSSPSVKYRGIFLNDEQPGLTGWVATNFADADNGAAGYGPSFYAHVLELILRLRANYLWPAIWASMYEVDFASNQPLADAYEVVLGSSHTEPLMRAQNEFGKFYQGAWAYNENNVTIDEYFRYGVQRARPYARNSLWTMGMRGTGDTAIEGLGTETIVAMLETLVNNQQQIISEGLGGVNISSVPQMWCLYKEVQTYIFEGLTVPDDVTLLWADDNWGNVRRFPLSNETGRAGGAGVYYHFDYVGDPRNYKWINTVQLAKTAEQMHMAYSRGADRIWIVNVGDLKPVEIPISHFMDMAYDVERWNLDSTEEWAAAWAAREFGSAAAAEISEIMIQYGIMANRRKFELIEPQSYSVINYNEGDTILAEWAALEARAQAVHDGLDATMQPSFFQMVLHPIQGGSIVNQINIGAAKNSLYAGQKRNAANSKMMEVIALSGADSNLTDRWDSMLDGKWAHILDQTHLGYDGYWQQPMRNTLPAMRYVQTQRVSVAGHVGVGVEGSNATVQGDDQWHTNSANDLEVPPLEPHGASTRYFDVFSRGTKECTWTAEPLASFVKLSQSTGTVGPTSGSDTRVYISVDWDNAPAAPNTTTVGINVTNSCRGLDKYGFSDPQVQVPVYNRLPPSNFTSGFIEADGHVAIDGPNYQAIVAPTASDAITIAGDAAENLTYHTFKGAARTGDGVGLVPQNTEKLSIEQAPALEYQLYLFSNSSQANVTVWISPSQNYLGDETPLSYAISLYAAGSEPNATVVTPVGRSINTNMPAGWGYAVADGVWGKTTNYTTSSFDVPQEGAYTLRIWALMPSVIVQKVIVDMGGARPSYLGPPQSFLLGRDERGVYNGTSVLYK